MAVYAASSTGESTHIPTTLEQEVAAAYTSARLENAQATGRMVKTSDGVTREIVTLTIDAPQNPAAEHSPGPTYSYDYQPTGFTEPNRGPDEGSASMKADFIDDLAWIDQPQGTAERTVNLEGLHNLGGHEIDNIYVGASGQQGDELIQSYRYAGTLVIDGNGHRITSVTITHNPKIPPVQIVRTEVSG